MFYEKFRTYYLSFKNKSLDTGIYYYYFFKAPTL